MTDILGYDPTTGKPVSVPQEAAAQHYADGKITFKPDDKIPVVLNGVAGTLPHSEVPRALAAGDATLNFDPHSLAKATGVAAVRGASMGATDWLAIEGQKFFGDPDGAERTRQSLDALQKEHPLASSAAELAGSIAPALIPGGAEVEGLRGANLATKAGEAALGAERTLAPEAVKAGAEAALGSGADAARATFEAGAGTTKGSALSRTLRAANPYEYVGKVGGFAEDHLSKLLTPGVASVAGPMTRFAVEGALLNAASTVDESELGDTDLTAETILASMEHGALYGGALGLTAGVGKKILTSAGRIANRLGERATEANLGGTVGQMKQALGKYGPGSIGNFMLENGWHPKMNAEQAYEWARGVKEQTGMDLGQVVKDADGSFEGLGAMDGHKAMMDAVKEKLEKYSLAGGNPQALVKVLDREGKIGLGLKLDPDAPELKSMADAEQIYEKAWKEAGLVDPTGIGRRPRPPPEPPVGAVKKAYAAAAEAEGLHPKIEKLPKTLKPEEIGEFRKRIEAALTDPATSLKDKRALGVKLLTPGAVEREALGHVHEGINARNARRMELFNGLRAEAKAAYGAEVAAFEKKAAAYEYQVSKHSELKKASANQIIEDNAALQRQYENARELVRRHNESHKVSFAQAREVRKRVDGAIPWSYAHSANAVDNAANEIKLAARHALENHIEAGFDKHAASIGDDAAKGRYMHLKQRYAMANDIAEMAEKGRARHANMFGRPSRVGGISHVMGGMGLALSGHPLGGVMMGLGGVARHFAPKMAAYAVHKATRIAELKALRQEVAIGVRRGVRAAAHQTEAGGQYAKVAVQELSPEQARMTAAEAMTKVVKLAGANAELKSRLAAQAPDLALVAPKTFAATEGAYRRAVTWLASQVPPRVAKSIAAGEKVNPKDLTDETARSFLEHAAVTVDPRVATDALAAGTLSADQAKSLKAVWPAIANSGRATLQRIRAMDNDDLDFLPHHRKAQLQSAFGGMGHDADASFTLQLQINAASMAGSNEAMSMNDPPGKGKKKGGMAHAAATSRGMAASIALNATDAQAAEAGPPGRRKKAEDSGL